MKTLFHHSIFISVIFFILINNVYSQQGWYNLNVNFGGGAVYFKDINNGMISSYKTSNGGSSWSQMGFEAGGRQLSFPNQNIGYGVNSGVTKTTNFGDSWIRLTLPNIYQLYSISFFNINVGFICGEYGQILNTTNGGINWTFITLSFFQINYNFYNIQFTDSIIGYMIGSHELNDTSVFLKTTNGGINWTPKFYSNSGRFHSMYFINSNTGYIGSRSSIGSILKTTNGGNSWYQVFLPTSNRINSIHFPSASTGYGACFGGQIIKTTNSGINWFLQTTMTGSSLNSIFFINDATGYVSGEGVVLKTTDGGGPPIGIEPISNIIPAELKLYQNYPNPFNPKTTIRFDIPNPPLYFPPKEGKVRLVIYNSLGQKVETLVNEILHAGSFSIEWIADKYPTGIYLYRLEINDFIMSKKMVLVK